MPLNKYATIRYQVILDALRSKKYPTKDHLRQLCEEKLYGTSFGTRVSISTIEKDIWVLKNESALGYHKIVYDRAEGGYFLKERIESKMNREQHLLVTMAEECSEVIQRIAKALRFGINETEPGQNLDNNERIIYELNDLFAVVDMLKEAGTFDGSLLLNLEAIEAKKIKVEKYMEYAEKLGVLGNIK